MFEINRLSEGISFSNLTYYHTDRSAAKSFCSF